MSRADLLLEIGSEEIPAGYLPPAAAALRQRVCRWLEDKGFAFEDATTFATPRRVAVRVASVELERPTRTEQKLGPAVKAAFDGDGNPRPAAVGFARSAGIEVAELERVDTDKGERIAATVTTGGERLLDLMLSDLDLAELVQLGFPKTMRWVPGSDLRYARPIRWLVCLVGGEVVPLRLGAITAGRASRGHRTLAPAPVEIPTAEDYESVLEVVHVRVDPAQRRTSIERAAREAAASVGGQVHADAELLEEITYLAEHPLAVVGSYEQERVDQLPAEVIITAMRSHQRYFSIEREDGHLLPHFITFRDGGEQGLTNVVEGNERVLRARLADAAFYWDEDRAVSSDEKLERLDRVVWLEGLGSVKAKCERIAELAAGLAEALHIEVDAATLRRASLLCKSDLATEMIKDGKEFTKLQGTIGRYYALEAGETPEVADAIREHLHPRGASDRLPVGELGTLVALADRLDSIAGCVRAGFAPSGGQDPYALRRQSLAVLRLLLETEHHLDLQEWIDVALRAQQGGSVAPDEAPAIVADLFWGRLETLLSDLPVEIVRGVLSVSRLDPVENDRAARALAAMRDSDSFGRLLEGAKRCRNILVKEGRLAEEQLEGAARADQLRARAEERWVAWQGRAEGGPEDGYREDLFRDDAERALHAAVLDRVESLESARAGGDHEVVFATLAELGPVIGTFFDEVLVNAKEEALRQNRLGFLEQIHYLFARFADLSRVVAR